MTADLFLRNRGFLSRIRAESYVRARKLYREAEALFPAEETVPGRDLLRALDALLEELEAACEYASDAVRGLKRNRVKRSRKILTSAVISQNVLSQMLITISTYD
jgi:hypothetical protein